MGKADDTQKRILELAKAEFLEKGFKDASARNIAKTGNITTGSIYRYFANNESLFDALVETAANSLYDLYSGTQQSVINGASSQELSSYINSDNGENIQVMLDCIYENWDAFRLIVCCSEGTKYAEYINSLADVAVKNTHELIRALKKDGKPIGDVSDFAIRTLCRNTLAAIFEVVAQQIPKENASGYIQEVFHFYNAGWKKLLGI